MGEVRLARDDAALELQFSYLFVWLVCGRTTEDPRDLFQFRSGGNARFVQLTSPTAVLGSLTYTKHTPRGPYRRRMPSVLGGVLGGWAFSAGRGTPVRQGEKQHET